jgi:hypothetical protein
MAEMTEHQGLPVAGYRPQTATAILRVNDNKIVEEHLLQLLDEVAASGDADPRWLSIARTHIEQGFMAFNRAIFKPERVNLNGL